MNRQPIPFTMKTSLNLLYGLEEDELSKFNLIERYWGKCSDRLKDQYYALYEKSKHGASETVKQIVYRPNPLLNMLKHKEFKGTYVPIPLAYDND